MPEKIEDTQWKMGMTEDFNARLSQYRTDMPECKINYLLYLTENQLLEKSMLTKYRKNLTANNHEYVSGMNLETLIKSAEGILKNLEVEYTVEKNLNKYNDFYANILENPEELVEELILEKTEELVEELIIEEKTPEKLIIEEKTPEELIIEESIAGDTETHIHCETRVVSSEDSKNKFICTICNKSFIYEVYFNKHNLNVHNIPIPIVNERECPVCHKILASKGKVQRHIRSVHEKTTEEKCDECDNVYSSGSH